MRLVSIAMVSLAFASLAAATAVFPGESFAQSTSPDSATGVKWFPDRWVIAALIAAPREIRLAGGLYSAERNLDFEPDGSTLESEISLGYRIPVVRLMDGGAEGVDLDLGFEVGIWSRFNMETDERDLIGSDYRVGFPLSVRYRSLEGRLTLHHSSSHLGDDFIKRNGVWVYQVSREALELILAVRPIEPVRLYGGGDLNVGRGFDYGIDDDFIRDPGDTLKPGPSALFLLVAKATPDKVIAEIEQDRPHILGTSLSQEREDGLRDLIARHVNTGRGRRTSRAGTSDP